MERSLVRFGNDRSKRRAGDRRHSRTSWYGFRRPMFWRSLAHYFPARRVPNRGFCSGKNPCQETADSAFGADACRSIRPVIPAAMGATKASKRSPPGDTRSNREEGLFGRPGVSAPGGAHAIGPASTLRARNSSRARCQARFMRPGDAAQGRPLGHPCAASGSLWNYRTAVAAAAPLAPISSAGILPANPSMTTSCSSTCHSNPTGGSGTRWA